MLFLCFVLLNKQNVFKNITKKYEILKNNQCMTNLSKKLLKLIKIDLVKVS